MKTTIENIKIWGLRDYLCYYAPKPLSYLGDAWNWFLPRHRYNWLDKIKCTLNPQQRWIKKHIEYNQWCDKVELIPKFLFGCVVHFVEEEEAFKRIAWDESGEGHKEFADELQECYNYITIARPALEQQLDDAWDKIPMNRAGKSYNELYGEVNDIENTIADNDRTFIAWIVKKKDYMWT